MAQVSTIAQSVRELAGGLDHFDLPAANVRELLRALDARYPGLADHIRTQMALAIDGELHHNAWDTPLAPDAEVVLIPNIVAG